MTDTAATITTDILADILAACDQALADHGRKTFVEIADFVDVLLDIRGIAADSALDSALS